MAKVGCCDLIYIAHWQYAAKGVITTSHATWSLYRSAVLKLIITCYFECLRSLMKLEHLSLLATMVSRNNRITIQFCYFTVLKIVIPVI